LPLILEKGIEIAPLLNSDVFTFEFDYDEWPMTHNNDERMIRPYNYSIFAIRQHYLTTFPDKSLERMPDQFDPS
jgi:hypothetical protein